MLEATLPPARRGVPSVLVLTPLGGTTGAESGSDASPGENATSGVVADAATIDQFGLQFAPRFVALAVGGRMSFTNSEASLVHNVQVRSMAEGSVLLDGDTAPGERLDVTLEQPGGYDVLCDVHPGMTAVIFVTDASHAFAADADGHLAVFDLPPGSYVSRIWTEADGLAEPVEIRLGTELVRIGGGPGA